MRGENFLKNMNRLTSWFRRPPLNEEQMDIWFDRVQEIPDRIFLLFLDQIIDTAKYMPTPAEVIKLFGEYKVTHPDEFLVSDTQAEFCQACHGTGVIKAWRIYGQYSYEYALACAHCQNWRRFFPTKASGPPAFISPPKLWRVEEVEAAGFFFADPMAEKPGTQKMRQYADVPEMASAVAEEMC